MDRNIQLGKLNKDGSITVWVTYSDNVTDGVFGHAIEEPKKGVTRFVVDTSNIPNETRRSFKIRQNGTVVWCDE